MTTVASMKPELEQARQTISKIADELQQSQGPGSTFALAAAVHDLRTTEAELEGVIEIADDESEINAAWPLRGQ